MGKFCMNCGKELDDNIRFCSGCGAEVSGSADVSNNSTAPNNQGANNYQNSYNSQNAFNNSNNYNAQMPYNNAFNPNTPESLLRTLSERYKINGIIWFIIAGIQVILGITINWILLIVAALNIVAAVQDLNYSKNILIQPQGIVNKEKPLVGSIAVLVYNLFFGGILGVAGSIYYLVGIRNFVMTNANAFMALEQQPQRTF